MPLVPPSLDDRSFDDLVADLLARIPAHAPEYTHPAPGDPGRTLIELFAWLGDTLLYRANLIPERQRLVFLSLLGLPMRPADAARGVVSVDFTTPATEAATLPAGARLDGVEPFETTAELGILPVRGVAFYKRRLDRAADPALHALVTQLEEIYDLERGRGAPYATTPAFVDGRPLDPATEAVDASVWVALLAGDPASVSAARADLSTGARRIQVGLAPVDTLADTLDPLITASLNSRGASLRWQVTGAQPGRALITLEQIADTIAGLTRPGVITLALPSGLSAPSNDVRADLDAGVGERPPRLDDPDLASRLVTWLRVRLPERASPLPLAWVGVNAVPVDHRRTERHVVIGQSDESPDQVFQLPGTQVDLGTLQVDVEEAEIGYRTWRRVEHLAITGPDDPVFEVDAEAGLLRFGDGVRGRVPVRGARVRVVLLRHGGGVRGNLGPGSLKSAVLEGRKLTVTQSIPTWGGRDAETLADAERRIPAFLQHRERAVTASDFATLTRETPGVALGRVEVLPGFRPQTFDTDLPGVVSVLVWPEGANQAPPNPRPDRRLIEAIHGWLDPRRLLGTELYVIGNEYVPIAISAAVEVRAGHPRDETLAAVRAAIRGFLWPLAPGGPFETPTGWPLGRPVRDREIEVAVSRVPGVDEVVAIHLFTSRDGRWRSVRVIDGVAAIPMERWQLPELASLAVGDGPTAPALDDDEAPSTARPEVPVPVVPEVC